MSLKESAPVAPEAVHGSKDDGRLLVIEPTVMESADHVFGNLFQRLYHAVERMRGFDEASAKEFGDSTRQLEDCVQLLMDYVSPYEPSLQEIAAHEVVASFVQQLSEMTGAEVTVSGDGDSNGRLLVDAGRLSRAFRLLSRQLSADLADATRIALSVNVHEQAAVLEMAFQVAGPSGARRSSASELQWAVAERLFDIHGGALREQVASSGELHWKLVLPLHS
jgi:hypothetical protein